MPLENSANTPDTTVSPQRKRPILKRFLKILGIISGGFVVSIVLLMGCIALILTPSRLTPLVNEYSSKYLDAQINFDTVSLSVFENFPYVSIKLSGGEIISHAFDDLPDSLRAEIPAAADTLLRFDEFTLSLNLPQLLRSQIALRRISLTRPEIYAYVSPWGKANWEIYATDTLPDNQPAEPLDLQIDRIRIQNQGRLTYDSRPDTLYAQILLDNLRLRHTFLDHYTIDLATTNNVQIDTLQLCDTLSLGLKGGFTFNPKQPENVALENLTLDMGGIPIVFNGHVNVAQDSIVSRMQCTIHPLMLSKLIHIIPPQLLPALRSIDTNLALNIDTRINGSYRFADGRLPRIDLDVNTNSGYLSYQHTKARINRLILDASLRYDPQQPDSTGAVIRNFDIQGSGMEFRGNGTAWNLLKDPSIQLDLIGSVNLDTLTVLFPSKNDITVRGHLGVDADASFRLSHMNIATIGKTRVDGTLTLDNLLIDIPRDTLFMKVDGGVIHFGSGRNRQDSLIRKGVEMLQMTIQADTVNINMKNNWLLATTGLSATAHSAASTLSGDTSVIHPLNGGVKADHFEMTGADSTWLNLRDVQSHFSIIPSQANASVPLLNLAFDAKTLQAKNSANKYDLNNSHIDLHVTLAKRSMDSTRRRHMLDSLQQRYPSIPRDSLFAHLRAMRAKSRNSRDAFAAADLDMALDKSTASLLRRWDATGVVRASSGRVLTPYFPLVNTLHNVDIEFSTDAIKLKNTQIQSGSSSLELTGELSNLRQVLLGRGELKVNMHIESDTLNFNELIHAANVGSQYEATPEAYRQSISNAESNEQLQKVITEQSGIADSVTSSSLIIIPSNIDVNIEICAHYGIYSSLHLNMLTGAFIARDRCLQIKDLKAITDAGEMTLTALYATRSRTDIITGFDVEMKQMKVDKLISLIPSVDTLLPMLRSFEGVLDCKMAATAAIDTLMNIDLSTLNAACSLHGENMVLLDGETFTEIAKMMRFKNKQRNIIERISVNLLIHDNQIEMFPFIIDMDRYKAAVSGIHKLDMSFNYHISVLKSPIPFRLGVNIFGTLDKFKFRLCKARYRSENIPSSVNLIDTTRINLRRTITDIFRKGIEAASLSELKITPVSDSTLLQSGNEALSRTDSLELQHQGILPADTLTTDTLTTDTTSVKVPLSVDSLSVTSEGIDIHAPATLPVEIRAPGPVQLTPREQRTLRREQKQAQKRDRKKNKSKP